MDAYTDGISPGLYLSSWIFPLRGDAEQLEPKAMQEAQAEDHKLET